MYSMNWVDQVLVAAYLKTKDEISFRMLYSRHTRQLWNMAMKLTGGNQQLSEEITQDTWMRAVQALPQFEWRSGFRTWLIKICINRWREEKRKKTFSEIDDSLLIIQPAESYTGDTEKIIALLPDGYKTVLLLHDLEGYKHEEIATMLDIAPGTSKSQLHAARKAFRNLIQKEKN